MQRQFRKLHREPVGFELHAKGGIVDIVGRELDPCREEEQWAPESTCKRNCKHYTEQPARLRFRRFSELASGLFQTLHPAVRQVGEALHLVKLDGVEILQRCPSKRPVPGSADFVQERGESEAHVRVVVQHRRVGRQPRELQLANLNPVAKPNLLRADVPVVGLQREEQHLPECTFASGRRRAEHKGHEAQALEGSDDGYNIRPCDDAVQEHFLLILLIQNSPSQGPTNDDSRDSKDLLRGSTRRCCVVRRERVCRERAEYQR